VYPNNSYVIILHHESMTSVNFLLFLFANSYFFRIAVRYNKTNRDWGISHYWKLFPLSLGNIAFHLQRQAMFPPLRWNNFQLWTERQSLFVSLFCDCLL